jgi:hypothetical protein
VPAPSYVIFLNGGYGVGKSSALDHVGDLLAESGSAFSLMDVDWFHRSWPPAGNDPENVLSEAENMSTVWHNYLRAGPRQPVVAGVIASLQDRDRYAKVFTLPIRSVRLVAAEALVEARLRRRYTEHQASSLAWHLERHLALTEALELEGLDEWVIDTSHLTPRSVAEAVLEYFSQLRVKTARLP